MKRYQSSSHAMVVVIKQTLNPLWMSSPLIFAFLIAGCATPPPSPKLVSSLLEEATAVSGTGVPKGTIEILVDGQSVAKGSVAKNGKFTVAVPPLAAEQTVTATQSRGKLKSRPSVPVTVQKAALDQIDISPAQSITIEQGQSQTFSVLGLLSNGKRETPLLGVTWGVKDSSIATVDSQGEVTGMKAGTTSIWASRDNIQSSKAIVRITPPSPNVTGILKAGDAKVEGEAEPFAKVQVLINGIPRGTTVLADAQGRWHASKLPSLNKDDRITSIQTVDQIQSDHSAPVVVGPEVLTHIALLPSSPVTVTQGEQAQITATGTFSNGKVSELGSGVTWTIENSEVVTIDSMGNLVGVVAGTTSILANDEDVQSAKTTVMVRPPPPRITGSLKAGDSIVRGEGTPVANIQVFINGNPQGENILADNQGGWQASGLPVFDEADEVSINQTVNNIPSEFSPVVKVLPNAPPVVEPISTQSVRLGDTLILNLTATDPEAEDLTFALPPSSSLSNSSLDRTSGLFTFTPESDQVGSTSVTVLVSDGHSTVEKTLTIDVALPKNLFVLLDNPDGSVGMIQVINAGGMQMLNQPAQAVGLVSANQPPTQPFILKKEEIQNEFGEALEVKPEDPLQALLYFETDTVQLTSESQQQLQELLSKIADRSASDIGVIGHTDRTASEEYNHQLSLRRAHAIRDLIVAGGIDPKMVEVTGHGENNPLVETADNVSEPLNRRVEIVVR